MWNLRRFPFILDHQVIQYERKTLWSAEMMRMMTLARRMTLHQSAPRNPRYFTAPAVSPATICRCANTVNNNTGRVTISAAAASGPQESWSNEIML